MSDQKMEQKLRDAIAGLDPANDAHWTQDGQANCNRLEAVVGFNVTRAMVKQVAPTARRTAVDSESESGSESGPAVRTPSLAEIVKQMDAQRRKDSADRARLSKAAAAAVAEELKKL